MQISNDAAAVKKMYLKTSEILSNLTKNNKDVEADLATLQARWDDVNYQNLKNVIEARRHDLTTLLKELDLFKQWLDQLHDKLYQYENAEQIK